MAVVAILAVLPGGAHAQGDCDVPEGALLPDLMTVVPTHLGLQNAHQREIVRFSNGIANLGVGLWWMEPENPDALGGTQDAYQVFGDDIFVEADGPPASDDPSFLDRCLAGSFEFHPDHNHWHISDVAEFRVCSEESFMDAAANGDAGACEPVGTSLKVTFCLIDWYKLGENTSTSDPTRNFFDCATGFQGVTPQWVDQYHQSTSGQQLDITGAAAGTYYLVSEVNNEDTYAETDLTNNASWTVFRLSRNSNGNPKLTLLGDACDDADYLDALRDTIEAFTDDSALRAAIENDMCGGASTNR